MSNSGKNKRSQRRQRKKKQRGGLAEQAVPIGLTLINMLLPGKGYFNQRKTRKYLRWPGTTPWGTTKHKNWSRRGTRGIHSRRW
jgi:hypothetical protein